MKTMQKLKLAMIILCLIGGLFGCASTQPVTPIEDQAKVSQADMTEQSEVKGVTEGTMQEEVVPSHDAVAGMERIHFDFDQFTLSSEARKILGENAKYLNTNSGVQVVVEGHCDERGSDEYNLALGESRALAAKNYLVSLGISDKRLSVISYGEEKPLVLGETEEAWAQNRRAEFKVVH
jgi:peptidoglycan-associated lipoprotein